MTMYIMTALELCDMVISDESNVMSEALMFHKPSIAVTDWLIPENPARLPCVPIDYIIKCKKSELRKYVEKLSSDAEYYTTDKKTACDFLGKKLTQKYPPLFLWN